MYTAELIGTSSKIENVPLSDIRNWLMLIAPIALDSIDWGKVTALPEKKAIKFPLEPYVLRIAHHADPELEEPSEDEPIEPDPNKVPLESSIEEPPTE
ncbi:hypothetical protein [Chroococcidiopsis sp.]|uniref:hypothetical protein n=1 Tax=Chroococcidiopsis sp. TaxID=3088168 RepID=UPI003F2DE3E0